MPVFICNGALKIEPPLIFIETVPCVLNIPEFKTELPAEATNDPDVIVKVNELRSKIPFVLMVKDNDVEIDIWINNVI